MKRVVFIQRKITGAIAGILRSLVGMISRFKLPPQKYLCEAVNFTPPSRRPSQGLSISTSPTTPQSVESYSLPTPQASARLIIWKQKCQCLLRTKRPSPMPKGSLAPYPSPSSEVDHPQTKMDFVEHSCATRDALSKQEPGFISTPLNPVPPPGEQGLSFGSTDHNWAYCASGRPWDAFKRKMNEYATRTISSEDAVNAPQIWSWRIFKKVARVAKEKVEESRIESQQFSFIFN